MTNIVYNHLLVGAALFVLGAIGMMTRRNLFLMVLSAELMLQGVSINFVTFSRMHGNYQGQTFTVFLLTVAACEAGLALALILALFHRKKSLDVAVWTSLREDTETQRIAFASDTSDVHASSSASTSKEAVHV